eukprot:392874-Pyramimonas_sp.AAC.1
MVRGRLKQKLHVSQDPEISRAMPTSPWSNDVSGKALRSQETKTNMSPPSCYFARVSQAKRLFWGLRQVPFGKQPRATNASGPPGRYRFHCGH